ALRPAHGAGGPGHPRSGAAGPFWYPATGRGTPPAGDRAQTSRPSTLPGTHRTTWPGGAPDVSSADACRAVPPAPVVTSHRATLSFSLRAGGPHASAARHRRSTAAAAEKALATAACGC